MKTSIKLIAVSALVLGSSVAVAELSYDPSEEYYAYFYGDTAISDQVISEPQLGQIYDPISDYYGTFTSDKPAKIVTSKVDNHMADPTNFYNW